MNNTIEGNKLIAEFMGILVDDFRWGKIKQIHLLAICEPQGHINLLDCEFYNPNSDWNQLMPAVIKIESIENSDSYEVDIFGNCCNIGSSDRFDATGVTKIEATWKAVIQFITWYNQSKQTKQ